MWPYESYGGISGKNITTNLNVDDDYIHSFTTVEMRVVGFISMLSSSSIILTFLIFGELRRLRYVWLVLYVSINDLLASTGI